MRVLKKEDFIMSNVDLSILTQRIVSSNNNDSSNTGKITGDTDTDKLISDYFKRKTNSKDSNPTDTLAEVYAKYDKNHDGKLSRSERQAAGMTRAEARAFNKAMKAFGGDDGNIKSYAYEADADGPAGTMYTDKNGKKLFSIANGDTGPVTTLYDKNSNVSSRIIERQNETCIEEYKDGKQTKETYEYTDAYSAANKGIKTKIYEFDSTGKKITKTTEFYDNGKIVKDYSDYKNSSHIICTYEGELPEVCGNKVYGKNIKNKHLAEGGTNNLILFEDGTYAQEQISDNTKTVNIYGNKEDRNKVTETKSYTKSENDEWVEVTQKQPSPADAAQKEDTPPHPTTAAKTFKDLFNSGETKIKVSSEVARDYNADVTLPENAEYTTDGYPKSIRVKLPSSAYGENAYMNLTYDEKSKTYKQKSGRTFEMAIDADGNISLTQKKNSHGRVQ